MSRCRAWPRAMVVLAALVVGCSGGGGPKRPPTHAVKGTVTLDGQPLAGALVSFMPAAGQQPANGTTDATGAYSLTSFTRGDGAMEGEYRIVVTKFPPAAAGATEGEYVPPTGELKPPQNELPARYAAPETSGFTATVTRGGGTFDFALSR